MKRIPSIVAILLLICAGLTSTAHAAGQATVSAAVDRNAARPGEAITLTVTIDVQKGLHAQSHTPTEKFYIPLTVTPKATPGVTFGPPVYPPGKNENYPGLGTLSIYTGRVTVKVPVTIDAGAAGGPARLSGVVRYQACNDTVCFPPQRAPFTVDLNIDAAGATASTTSQPTTTTAPADSAGSEAALPPPPADGWLTLKDDSYALAFVVAFLVGIVFNAVPCVLPVVPLKIAGFYEAAQHDRRRCFLLGLAFSIGLVASFGVLAVLVVGLKTLTWGGLFQQTWFTVAIVIVLLLMAASQFGLFTLNLPTAAYGFSPRHDTYVGNALFGVLTAALSTPCTIGPFSALLAWALKQPPTLGAAVIVVVGCGMASPYLVLSLFPQTMRRLPRTGPVGEIIKQTLAFFVLATAVYFARPLVGAWVPPAVFWWGLFAIIAAACVFLVMRTARSVGTRRAIGISSIIALLVLSGAAMGTQLLARNPHDWQPYSDSALAEAVAAGRPVLIDFTADWCLNCHTLEALTLNDGSVVKAVLARRVLMLKADVTYGTEAAVPLKNKLVPSGEIPLTAVYLPGRPEPTLLKGIYSTGELLRVLDEARVTPPSVARKVETKTAPQIAWR